MAIGDVIDLLACPQCRRPLALTPGAPSAHCPVGHAYDLARQGYLNLLSGRGPKNADTAAMVAARERLIGGGHYAPLADRLAQLAAARAPAAARVLEVGAGTGYYLAQVLQALPEARGVALDVSVPAARRAAGAHLRVGSVVADVWRRMPLLDGCVDVLVDVFAPRNGDEFARLLSTTGVLIVVVPGPEHLRELRVDLGLLGIQAEKGEQLRSRLGSALIRQAQEQLRFDVGLDVAAVRDLVAMGPNAFHLTAAEIEELARSVAAPVNVSVAVELSVWTRG